MESLLRLSGLLSKDNGGKIDLGTLEKHLADRYDTTGSSTSHNPHKINIPSQSQTAMPQQNSSSIELYDRLPNWEDYELTQHCHSWPNIR
jgi:hypothetical protein